jgi:hypothetical protein
VEVIGGSIVDDGSKEFGTRKGTVPSPDTMIPFPPEFGSIVPGKFGRDHPHECCARGMRRAPPVRPSIRYGKAFVRARTEWPQSLLNDETEER